MKNEQNIQNEENKKKQIHQLIVIQMVINMNTTEIVIIFAQKIQNLIIANV